MSADVEDPCASCAGGCCTWQALGVGYGSIDALTEWPDDAEDATEDHDGEVEEAEPITEPPEDDHAAAAMLMGKQASRGWLERLLLDGGSLPDMEWVVATHENGSRMLAFECGHLEDGLCSVYGDRPEMCRAFECPAMADGDDGMSLADWKQQQAVDPNNFETTDVTETVETIIRRATDNEH